MSFIQKQKTFGHMSMDQKVEMKLILLKQVKIMVGQLLVMVVNYSGTTFTDIQKRRYGTTLHYWDPSIAPSGMAFIISDKYGDWKGNLLVGSLKFQYLDHVYLKDNKVIKEERLLDGLGRVRCVEQGPDGYIYVGIENLGIVKLIRK